MTMLTMLGLALAGSGPLEAPPAPEADSQFNFLGSTRYEPGYSTLAVTSTTQRSFGRHVAGVRVAGFERENDREKQGMFSLSAHYGLLVVDHEYITIMPYIHAGGFVQGGVAARAHIPIGPARIGADVSIGATWELPIRRRTALGPEERHRIYGTLPEAGVFLDLGGPLRPTVRLGAQSVDPVVSVQIGGLVTLRGALRYDMDDHSVSAHAGLGLRFDDP